MWECREEGSAEAAVAAGGEKSSHPLCQHHRIQADIFLFPAVESHPTSCTSQLTSSQDLSQSTSGDEALRQQLLPLVHMQLLSWQVTPAARTAQQPGSLSHGHTDEHQHSVWSQSTERRNSIAASLETSVRHCLTKLTEADSFPLL